MKPVLLIPLLLAWTGVAMHLQALAGMPVYRAAPIDARVVDATTGKPVQGANVIANWQLVTETLHGEKALGQLEVKETVTDGDGRFHFDGFTKANPSLADLGSGDPQIVIFRRDYEPKVFMNHYGMQPPVVIGITRTSQLSGTTIKLEPAVVDVAGKGIAYFGVATALDPVIANCQWKKIPRAIVAMTDETARIATLNRGKAVALPTIGTIEGSPAKCGSAVEFFRGYRP